MTRAAKQGVQAFNRECNRPQRLAYRMPHFAATLPKPAAVLEFGDAKSNLLDAANKISGL